MHHLWQGEWLGNDEVEQRLASLDSFVHLALERPLDRQLVISACDRLSVALLDTESSTHARLRETLLAAGSDPDEVTSTLTEVGLFLRREDLERKVRRELGGVDAGRLARPDARTPVFEAWVPVGVLVHVLPANSATVGPLAIVEGLLAGNLNIAKVSSRDTLFTHHVIAELAALDPSGRIAEHVVVLRFPSHNTAWLDALCTQADTVAVWGGEQAVSSVAEHVPAGCRLVEWGPRISFAYLTADSSTDPAVRRALAHEVCQAEQQACASPQVVYVDTEDTSEVFAFAQQLADELATLSPRIPRQEPELLEQAEISNVTMVAELEAHLGMTRVYSDPAGSWRVLADSRSELRTSPLYRTVWVKPLPRRQIVRTLRPMRRYLQTVGLAADRLDTAVLARSFLATGVLRVTPIGSMLESYPTEPHDGVYALPRYSRRVSVRLDDRFVTDSCLDDLVHAPAATTPSDSPVMTKDDFQNMRVEPRHAELFFKSGGSSGVPKLSVFTYDDYHEQMRCTGEGLLAAGFDPAADRAMNLFFGGGLYGGFVSFFSVLESLRAVQFPMAAVGDYAAVAETIAGHGVNTLFAMPSYLLRLFDAGANVLREYGGVRKIFYGGEHFNPRQVQRLRDQFGIELIRSAVYGSVDAGPLGHQCSHTESRVHHLFTRLHTLEILDPQQDRPVGPGEVGRLVFTARLRTGQPLHRYQIGDLGRWVAGDCGCGRRTPRFELLGRFGDVFRIASIFLNYQRFVTIAEEELAYAGELQIVLRADGNRESVVVRLDADRTPPEVDCGATFLRHYADLREVVDTDGLLSFAVEAVRPETMATTPGSGKLRRVVDERDLG
ncbi:acyl-CoA reductase [Longimycelium tulufanense]|nr:acyl-CoA reductase [Longimycelium tulufanense]